MKERAVDAHLRAENAIRPSILALIRKPNTFEAAWVKSVCRVVETVPIGVVIRTDRVRAKKHPQHRVVVPSI